VQIAARERIRDLRAQVNAGTPSRSRHGALRWEPREKGVNTHEADGFVRLRRAHVDVLNAQHLAQLYAAGPIDGNTAHGNGGRRAVK
jgi:hypothetical protein